MIALLATVVALASPPPAPSPYEIVSRAQAAWEARAVSPYLSFEIPCADTFLAANCAPGAIVKFTVRMSDGRTYASTAKEPALEMMCGGFIYGPASTPLGFFRSISSDNVPAAFATPVPQTPENFAEDPFGPKLIASVVVANRAYTVTLAGIESLDGASVYHLLLEPNYDREHHPLRELWVDTSTFEVRQLAYARHAESGSSEGSVRYRFAQVGPKHTWAIVYIEAELPLKGSATTVRPASALSNIEFSQDFPAWPFEPGCGRT